MKRDCPTIHELLCFDTLMRCKSMSRTAAALCLTVSAVSKHIDSLQRYIGQPLFRKHGRTLHPTRQGEIYWQRIAPHLRAIETATYELRAQQTHTGMLTLASVPTFLTRWLIPRLPDFRRQHPEITLSFSQHLMGNAVLAPEVDVAIRYGEGNWLGLHSEYLDGKLFVPIYSPALLPTGQQGVILPALADHTLLHHAEAPSAWQTWGHQYGLSHPHLDTGPSFTQYSALIQAAASGMGIGLVPRILVEDDLNNGILETLPTAEVTLDHGHYLCCHPNRLESQTVRAFRDWIMAQAQAA